MDPAQTPPPPAPVTTLENTPPAPPPPPANMPPATPPVSTPPPPPPPGITTDAPKKSMGKGPIVGALVALVVLIGGLAAGIYLSQRNQNVPSAPAAVCAPTGAYEKYCDTGSGSEVLACHFCDNNNWSDRPLSACDGAGLSCLPCGPSGPDGNGTNNTTCSNGGGGSTGGTCDSLSCNAGSGQFVRHFVCSTPLVDGKCDGPSGATVIFDTGDNRSLTSATFFGDPCTSEQIDIFTNFSDGRDPYLNAQGLVTFITRDKTGTNCNPPVSHDPTGNVSISCVSGQQVIHVTNASDPDATTTSLQTHFYFDSDPSDNDAAVLTDTFTSNGSADKVIPNTVARYAGTGPDVVLNNNQNHVLKAYLINATGTAGSNKELVGSPVTFNFAGCVVSTPTPTLPPGITPTITPTPTPGVAQCQQVSVVSITRNGTAVASPSLAKIQKGDVVVFRGFATATGTTVTSIDFTLTKGGTAQPVVHGTPTLVSGVYQADFSVTVDQAVSYSVSSAPVYN